MFERTKVDNAPEPTAVPVEVVLADGTSDQGQTAGASAGKTLSDVLNGTAAFSSSSPTAASAPILSKAQLASSQAARRAQGRQPRCAPARPGQLQSARDSGRCPRRGREEIRQAYHTLAKSYHPDRYASAELPVEVQDYLSAMARRVNAAYAALNVEQKKQAAAGSGVHRAGAAAAVVRQAHPGRSKPE